MKRRGEITAFYIETLILIVVMIGILLVLTQVLGISRRESARARRLTEAVTIAQNAAEILSETGSLREAVELLELEEASVTEAEGENQTAEGILHWIHEKEDGTRSEADYLVVIDRSSSEGMTEDAISVFSGGDGEEPIYSLTVRQIAKEEAA